MMTSRAFAPSHRRSRLWRAASPVVPVLQRQAEAEVWSPQAGACACGGGCPRCTSQSLLPMLEVSRPDDPLEREADRIADAVTSGNILHAQRVGISSLQRATLQRTCPCGGGGEASCTCEDTPESQGAVDGAGVSTTRAPASVGPVLASVGEPLAPSLRSDFERAFSYDFSNVRVHRDAAAAESARDVGALAYSVGSDIAFAAGRYSPEGRAGLRLIAHELAHVVQQSGSAGFPEVRRQAGGGAPAPPAPAPPAPAPAAPAGLHVTYNGCTTAPFHQPDVEAAAVAAYNAVLTSGCIHSPVLQAQILSQFGQLTIDCEHGNPSSPCGRAMYVFSHTANIYPDSLVPGTCGPLESTILHEVVHLTEVRLWGHGDLAGACEASCFGVGTGDPARCTDEGRVRHGPSVALGIVPGVTGGAPFLRFGYDVMKSWAASAFTLGLRLDVPLTDKDSFVRAGLEVGANHQLLGALYGRVLGGLSVPWPPGSQAPSLYAGAGLGLDIGRGQLELLYDVLEPQSKDERTHQLMLGLGFRFGRTR